MESRQNSIKSFNKLPDSCIHLTISCFFLTNPTIATLLILYDAYTGFSKKNYHKNHHHSLSEKRDTPSQMTGNNLQKAFRSNY